MKKTFVLDTNVLIHDPSSVYSFDNHLVVIPMTVLEELDACKNCGESKAQDAGDAIRLIDKIVGNERIQQISEGIKIKRQSDYSDNYTQGFLAIHRSPLGSKEDGFFDDLDSNDNRIINCALRIQKQNTDTKVVLVTKDINLRLKALGVGVNFVEDYLKDQLVSDTNLLPSGYIALASTFWEEIDPIETWEKESQIFHRIKKSFFTDDIYINQYFIDSSNDFGAIVVNVEDDEIVILEVGKKRFSDRLAWGIRPLNIVQGMAMHSLLNCKIDLNIVIGPAGSGKTMLALACALELVIERKAYSKVIVTRSTPSIAEDIGFLPGTESEKMMPWMLAIRDNLESLHFYDDNPEGSIQFAIDKANIKFKSLNFIRGRSVQNAIVIVDESQNLTPKQLKTVLTRCGKDSKIICLGNLNQIDCKYLTSLTSGLTYVIEKFKTWNGASINQLTGVVRSPLASYAEQNL